MSLVNRVRRLQGGHSPGKPGKVREFQSNQGKWKTSGNLKFASDFERVEELKLQLMGLDFGYVHH